METISISPYSVCMKSLQSVAGSHHICPYYGLATMPRSLSYINNAVYVPTTTRPQSISATNNQSTPRYIIHFLSSAWFAVLAFAAVVAYPSTSTMSFHNDGRAHHGTINALLGMKLMQLFGSWRFSRGIWCSWRSRLPDLPQRVEETVGGLKPGTCLSVFTSNTFRCFTASEVLW